MTSASNGPKVRIPQRATTNVAVREAIRAAIINGTLAPGEKLVQSEFAELLQTSITPVREALRELAAEGLVDFDSYRGASVHKPTVQEIKEVYAIREVLVPLALTQAAPVRTEEDFAELDRLVELMEATDDVVEWAFLNRDFHRSLTRNPEWPKLTSIIDNLRDTAYFVALTLVHETRSPAEANSDHRAMIDAMRHRDIERLATLSVAHLRGSLDALVAALEG